MKVHPRRKKQQVSIRRSNNGECELIGEKIGRTHEGVKREKLREKRAREKGFEEGIPKKSVFERKGVEKCGR